MTASVRKCRLNVEQAQADGTEDRGQSEIAKEPT
jgi:hypothetical protein